MPFHPRSLVHAKATRDVAACGASRQRCQLLIRTAKAHLQVTLSNSELRLQLDSYIPVSVPVQRLIKMSHGPSVKVRVNYALASNVWATLGLRSCISCFDVGTDRELRPVLSIKRREA